jgi:predicted unusual protein kinase regulating ubiquinone biosynthesis (AarF/ABC1/UbiB family)
MTIDECPAIQTLDNASMKYQNNIPATKVERATKFVQTGIKVGGNYIKHYAKKAFDSSVTREDLHEENAADIYSALSELKGSALKVAQMMSMDRNLLPRAYTERFAMAQYSAPPLSGPLVVKTFTNYFGKTPQQMFDTVRHERRQCRLHRAGTPRPPRTAGSWPSKSSTPAWPTAYAPTSRW